MNHVALKHFLALAEHLHFGQASTACNISKSALSRHVRQIEEEVGVRLFERDNRAVTLTAEGLKFQQYAVTATRQWQELCHELADSSDELHGEISLYCSVTASHSILFDLLNRFRPDYPGIEIKLHTGDPEHAVNRVLTGREDIAIAAVSGSAPRGVAFKAITVSPLVFIAARDEGVLSKSHRFQSDNSLPIAITNANSECSTNKEYWAQVSMILSESGIARTRVNEWFRQLGVRPRIYAQVAGNEAIVSMVSLGLGIGVVPKIVLDNSPLADRIIIIDAKPALEPYHVGLCTLKKNLSHPLVNAFWQSVE